MNKDLIKLIEKICKTHIQQEQKLRTDWTSDDFKLINGLKNKLIIAIESLDFKDIERKEQGLIIIGKDEYREMLKRAAVCEKMNGKEHSYTALVKEIERLQ